MQIDRYWSLRSRCTIVLLGRSKITLTFATFHQRSFVNHTRGKRCASCSSTCPINYEYDVELNCNTVAPYSESRSYAYYAPLCRTIFVLCAYAGCRMGAVAVRHCTLTYRTTIRTPVKSRLDLSRLRSESSMDWKQSVPCFNFKIDRLAGIVRRSLTIDVVRAIRRRITIDRIC